MAINVIEFSGRLGALKYPFFRRYWLGSFASVGATQLQVMALGWLLFELTESTLMLGYLGAAASIPTEIDLETGRHHQIRTQLSTIGSPIKGDLKYGFDRSNKDGSIHLHARKINFTHPVSKNQVL